MTLIFDRGNNSTENFDEVLGLLHVIAALDRQQARSLLAAPRSEFRTICRDSHGQPIFGRATSWVGFDHTWRALVISREETAREQRKRWERTKKEVLARVGGWRAALASGRSSGRMAKSWMRALIELIPRDYRGCSTTGSRRSRGRPGRSAR